MKKPLIKIKAKLMGSHMHVSIWERASEHGDTFALCGQIVTSPAAFDCMLTQHWGGPHIEVELDIEPTCKTCGGEGLVPDFGPDGEPSGRDCPDCT